MGATDMLNRGATNLLPEKLVREENDQISGDTREGRWLSDGSSSPFPLRGVDASRVGVPPRDTAQGFCTGVLVPLTAKGKVSKGTYFGKSWEFSTGRSRTETRKDEGTYQLRRAR